MNTTIKDRPILMNGEMVCATIDGRKTKTRRMVKLPNQWSFPPAAFDHKRTVIGRFGSSCDDCLRCPYGAPGDRLWVREAWQVWEHEGISIAELTKRWNESQLAGDVIYRADDPEDAEEWRPSIHMPRWASRLTLEVLSVRVERVQDISEEDAKAEGCVSDDGAPVDGTAASERFALLWDSINGPGAWQRNDWVWVLEFRKVPA